MNDLEREIQSVSDGIDRVLGERALLLESLRNVCDAAQTDADTCVVCRQDLARHASGCAVAAGLAAIKEVEGQ